MYFVWVVAGGVTLLTSFGNGSRDLKVSKWSWHTSLRNFSLPCWYFLLLFTSKYSRQHPVVRAPSVCVLPMERQTFLWILKCCMVCVYISSEVTFSRHDASLCATSDWTPYTTHYSATGLPPPLLMGFFNPYYCIRLLRREGFYVTVVYMVPGSTLTWPQPANSEGLICHLFC